MNLKQKALLRIYLNNKNYDKYNALLIDEIKKIFEKKIRNKNSNYKYISLSNLFISSKKFLSSYDFLICRRFYNLLHENSIPQYLSIQLTTIYEGIIHRTKT